MPTGHRSPARRPIFTRRRVIAYLSLYLLFLTVGCAIGLTDRLVMIPSTQPIKLNDIERVTIAAADKRTVDLYRRRQPATTMPADAFALEFIGNADRAESIASLAFVEWGDRRVESYALNYPGYGQSTGPATLKGAADSGLIAYDWLRARAGDRPIYVVGTSLGTTVALHVAAERPDVAGLVLTNPPPLRQLIRGRFGWWNLWLLAGPISWGIPGELDSLANSARCHQRAIFMTSGRDEVVPIAYQRRVVDAYAGPKQVTVSADARHNTGIDAEGERWLATQIEWLTAKQAD